MVELDSFRALAFFSTGIIELERGDGLRVRTKFWGWLIGHLGFPVQKQRRIALTTFVKFLRRDYLEEADELLTLSGISVDDDMVTAGQLRSIFLRIDLLAAEKPNPLHFIEATEELSELIGRALNGSLSRELVIAEAARLESLGLASALDEYFRVVIDTAVDDQAVGRQMQSDEIVQALADSDILTDLAHAEEWQNTFTQRLAKAMGGYHFSDSHVVLKALSTVVDRHLNSD